VDKIAGINTAAWTNDERESLRSVCIDLKNQINGFLNPKSELR
jgi:hypothetical protein